MTDARPSPRRRSPRSKAPPHAEDVRIGLGVDALARDVADHLRCTQGRAPQFAALNDVYLATAYAVRDRLMEREVHTIETVMTRPDAKVVSYLSAEFLMGPHLGASLVNLGAYDAMREALERQGFDFDAVLAQEEEPGLGNGGLGRLAACFLESLATLEVPAIGHGIRYEFGIFDQEIRGGRQIEIADKWLHWGNPWEIARPELTVLVKFGGHTEPWIDAQGRRRVRWVPARVVRGVPHDTPVLGWHVQTCIPLRLWAAEAVESFDFQAFNAGDYARAVDAKVRSENISKVLYPNDDSPQGRALRLEQQYFFVSSSLQDMLRLQAMLGQRPQDVHRRWAVQLNDTHPSVAVAELMRLLVDEHAIGWDEAWDTTVRTMGYTNHTLLPEALEKWPVDLFRKVLPRHWEIVLEINRRLLEDVRRRYPGDDARVERMSLIDERGGRSVRMANLACAGSHAINGVAALHTRLLKRDVLADWVDMFPERFLNVTNGVTPRRFVELANPGLSRLVTEKVGGEWPRRLDDLRGLEAHADDPDFQRRWREVKLANKHRLAEILRDRTGVVVDPESLFDVQVKRIHEYKRQHLNVLHVLTLFVRLRRNPSLDIAPRTVVFAGKAAPGYRMAKLIIELIHGAAAAVNDDPAVAGRLKVAFLPDFNVTNAQPIYPAADLSEQISTAGKEASGTGNMKFTLNGALTIGTLDGANVEIRDEVGPENFFLFGLTTEQVAEAKARGYDPRSIYERDSELRGVIDLIASGALSGGDATRFRPLVDSLLTRDEYMLLADYPLYVRCQEAVDRAWRDQAAWTRTSILNTARAGKFSSDRSIREYCEHVWGAKPLHVPAKG